MIRPANLKDLDQIVEVEKEIFPLEPFSRRQYRSLIKSHNSNVFVAFDGKKMIATGSVIYTKLVNKTVKGRIYSIGVLKEYRRKGIATKLLRFMENDMNHFVSYITLETHKHHESVIKFYLKEGYVKTEDLPKYYEDGDGIRMKKIIFKHIPETTFKSVDYKDMRYPDLGDWWDEGNTWQIRTPKMNMDYEFMVFCP